MKNILSTVLVSLTMWMSVQPPTHAEAACVVNDPTGTPLNIRSRPGGSTIGQVANGSIVTVVDTDGEWAKVVVVSQGNAQVRGWVYSRYIACN